MGKIIDGKMIASELRIKVAHGVEKLIEKTKIVPRLSVILVGNDPGSEVYVRNKEKHCAEVGIQTETHRLPADIGQDRVIEIIEGLNKDQKTHGILVQIPLPKGLDEVKILNTISPMKDVDGLHPNNLGRLLRGEGPLFLPCTPAGSMDLILSTGVDIKGKEAVVVGRSNIVGKPMAIMLLEKHATVTICHSRTMDLPGVCRRADILVAAIGKPKFIQGDWIKEGAIVIDVGMNRLPTGLVGDVDYEKAEKRASFITPVPRGVGPMTIAMLLKNTLISAERFAGYR